MNNSIIFYWKKKGMLPPESYPHEERDRAEEMKIERYKLQEKYESEFKNVLVREKENVSV